MTSLLGFSSSGSRSDFIITSQGSVAIFFKAAFFAFFRSAAIDFWAYSLIFFFLSTIYKLTYFFKFSKSFFSLLPLAKLNFSDWAFLKGTGLDSMFETNGIFSES